MRTMRTITSIFLCLGSACVVFQGCEPGNYQEARRRYENREWQKAQTVTFDVDVSQSDTKTSMILAAGALLKGFSAQEVTEYGFYYGYESVSTPEEYVSKFTKKVVSDGTPTKFSASVDYDSRQGVRFYCVAYVAALGKVFYSDESRYLVMGYRITVNTSSDFTGLTFERATVYGDCDVEEPVLFPITERGFCYINTHNRPGVSPTLTVNDGTVEAGGGSGEFSATITGLQPGAAYKVRAYATNYQGTTYSVSYVTLPMYLSQAFVPSVFLLPDMYDPMKVTASISRDNGYMITEKGFCYNTAGITPTINDTKVADGGTGLGDFEYSFSGKPPGRYHVRSYAVNKAGTGYSATTQTITVP